MGKCIVAVACIVALGAAGSAWAAGPPSGSGPVVVKVGETRSFAASRLQPGERVRCINNGHVLSVDAPASSAISNGTVWTQSGTIHFHLHVTATKSGGYVVDCGLGGFHWAPIAAAGTKLHRTTDSYLAI
jgi:hypothetical protein